MGSYIYLNYAAWLVNDLPDEVKNNIMSAEKIQEKFGINVWFLDYSPDEKRYMLFGSCKEEVPEYCDIGTYSSIGRFCVYLSQYLDVNNLDYIGLIQSDHNEPPPHLVLNKRSEGNIDDIFLEI